MDFGKALTFITEDPRWQQKIAIATGVFIVSTILSVVFIGIVGFLIFAGYCVRLLQNVRDGQPQPLPEWDQWGEDLLRGFKLAVVGFVWALPVFLFAIPSVAGSAMSDSYDSGVQFIGAILAACGGCLSALYGIFVALVTPGFSIAFARDEQISSGLRFGDIWGWTQANLGQVVIVTLVYLVASFAFGLVGLIVGAVLCIVGLIITLPLAAVVTSLFEYHLFGQLAYAYPMGPSGRVEPLPPLTPPGEMVPGVTPPVEVPPSDVPPVSSTGEYPGSGIEEKPLTPPDTPA